MKRRIHDFNGFLNEMNGYGDEPFFFAKDGEQCNYLFKIESKESDKHVGLVISIGKFSKFTEPGEAKAEYGVISITKLTEAELDQAVTDKGKFESNEHVIEVDSDMLGNIMVTLTQAIENYLQNNSKVNKFYDEMQSNIQSDIYEEYIKNSVDEWPGEWNFQEIEKMKLNLISK